MAALTVLVLLSGACRTEEDGAIAPVDQIDADALAAADPGWVGSVDGRDAFAAVVAGGGRVVAYVCDGATHRFVLERAVSDAGLYRVEDPEAERDGVRAGWIVDNDGDQRGSVRIRDVSSPAPALPGSTLTVQDASYTVVVYSVPTRPAPSSPTPVPIPYPISDKVS